MKKGTSQEIKDRIEAIEGMDVRDAAEKRYLVERRSFRWLAVHWNVNGRTVGRVLREHGIRIRHGGEAVATQWIDNPARRAAAGANLASVNHTLAKKGLHVRQGKTKSNSDLVRGVSEKLKTSSSFFREGTKRKAVRNSIAARRAHPERMSALRTGLSKAETLLLDHLLAMELQVEVRHLCGIYVVDFIIPELGIIIDCQGRNRFPLSFERNKAILENCRGVVYCVNEYVHKGNFSHLDEYVSRLKATGGDPSPLGKETVILGALWPATFR